MIYKGNGGGGHNDTLLSTSENETLFHNEYFGHIMRGVNPEYTEGEHNKTSSDVLLGDILIVCAQVMFQKFKFYVEHYITYLMTHFRS